MSHSLNYRLKKKEKSVFQQIKTLQYTWFSAWGLAQLIITDARAISNPHVGTWVLLLLQFSKHNLAVIRSFTTSIMDAGG